MEELRENIVIKDRYRLLRKLGKGGFGAVWLAEDLLLQGQQVAVKFYEQTSAEGQQAFSREYTRVQRLKHDNLLTATYLDYYDGRPFLVMDYCSQGSAGSHKGNMGERDIWQFIHDVAAGLAYMHSQMPPIIHQDIKPENVLLHQSGRFVITDFGISRSTASSSDVSEALKSAGTIAYMGPERFKSNQETIMASDIWSLGASIYELCTGNVPFIGGTGYGLGGVALTSGFEMPELPPSFSRELNATMQACMAKETWDRPRAAELADYAAAMLRGEHPKAAWRTSGATQKKTWSTKWKSIAASAVVILIFAIFRIVGIVKNHRAAPPRVADTTLVTDHGLDYGRWTGKLVNGKPCGTGTLEYYSSDRDGRSRYTGEMSYAGRHGKGELRYKNGDLFEGTFYMDNLEKGTYYNYANNLYFNGTFRNNAPHKGEWRYISTNDLYMQLNP